MQDKIRYKTPYLLQWLILGILVSPAVVTLPKLPDVVNSQNLENEKPSDPGVKRWSDIPKRAVALQDIQTYTDAGLTTKATKIGAKTHLNILSVTQTSFALSDGTFIKNDKTQVVSDIVTSIKAVNQMLYTISDAEVLYSPLTTFDNKVYDRITKGNGVKVDKVAITNWGTYYRVSFDGGKNGWVDASKLTSKNPKLDIVQAMLDKKYNRENYSIYIKNIDSEFTAGINQSKKMYSASLSKLPILYWVQKQINNGNSSLSDQFVYNGLVNAWTGAFQARGTGFLPKSADNQSYGLLDLINRTAKDSDNVASNMIAYYETNQFSGEFQSEITRLSGQSWNPVDREASSEMVGRVLEGLYNEGGASFNALIGTDYDTERIPAKLPSTVRIAHKIGTADEFNHDAALVFTSDPYILVIETNNNADSNELADISKDIYEVMK